MNPRLIRSHLATALFVAGNAWLTGASAQPATIDEAEPKPETTTPPAGTEPTPTAEPAEPDNPAPAPEQAKDKPIGDAIAAPETVPPVVPKSPTPQEEESTTATNSKTSLRSVLQKARTARCKTAICFGEDNKWALEPLAELPIGSTFSPWNGRSHPLGSYINNHTYSASLNAGIRFWLFWDWVSLATYFSAPLTGDDTIRIPGSSYEFSSNRVKRPYPGIAVGLFGDIVWLGANIEELHNGDTDQSRDPTYARNAVIDRELTLTIAFAPLAMIRDGIGIGTATSDEKK